MRRLLAAVLLFVAGCATGPPPPPPPATAAVPDLRGTWTGIWGQAPMTLIVLDQREGHGESALSIGSWQVLGQPYPTVSGVLTATIDGAAVSTHMEGLVGVTRGRPVLRIRAQSTAGEQWLLLRMVAPDRLEGDGDSQYPWGPRGPVRLARHGRPPA